MTICYVKGVLKGELTLDLTSRKQKITRLQKKKEKEDNAALIQLECLQCLQLPTSGCIMHVKGLFSPTLIPS